jgi:hypothetical protein
MWEKNRVSTVFASGDEGVNGVVGATLITDASYPNNNRVVITSTDHGIKAGSTIVFPDLTNYIGTRNVYAVAANTMTIDIPETSFVAAQTPGGAELWYAGLKLDQEWELIGFTFDLASVGLTDENLTVTIDAERGAAWDHKLWDYTMLGKQNVVWTPPDIDALPLEANDILKFVYTNTDDTLWGVKIMFRISS